jgi:two-component system cell cycle sensor histidine kinase/response regulator CckA
MKKTPRGGKRASKGVRAAKAAPMALLAGALRAQSEGVFIAERKCGAHGMKIVFANDSFCAMTGYSASELVQKAHGFLHLERVDVERLRHWLPKAHPGQPLVGEGYLLRADGSSISAAWSFDPLCDVRGRMTHVVATYRDQTEKRRLQEALVHAQRLDAVGRLAGGVAHDFNNLLSVINGYCEMLAAHVAANPQAMREVSEIHHAGRKAAALTSQLLAFSRRQPLNARVINLNELVTSNAEIIRRLLGEAGRLDLELSPGLHNVRTDPAQFQQVILNLVLNARDALRDRGRITISTSNRDIRAGLNRRGTDATPGHYVAITVTDNGTGMDAETLKHLFEPFFTTKPEGKGTGLGLALVYGVVQQSGGTITVKSALLVGSTFEILLPAVAEELEAAPPTVAPLPTTRGTETVLLIEDDDVVRKMVAGILTADGYRVISAKSPGAALQDLRDLTRPVQLLIANVTDDGEKFAKRLYSVAPELRILCTGSQEANDLVDWIPEARQVRLSKPYALSELLKTARKLLDS